MITPSNSPYAPDLRGFIAFLEKEHPEHIVRIGREVDPKFGVSGILERLERDGKFPLVIFENVKGSKIPLVANMHASFERLRLALGMDHGDIKSFVRECAARQANPIDPVMVNEAPVRQVVRLRDEGLNQRQIAARLHTYPVKIGRILRYAQQHGYAPSPDVEADQDGPDIRPALEAPSLHQPPIPPASADPPRVAQAGPHPGRRPPRKETQR